MRYEPNKTFKDLNYDSVIEYLTKIKHPVGRSIALKPKNLNNVYNYLKFHAKYIDYVHEQQRDKPTVWEPTYVSPEQLYTSVIQWKAAGKPEPLTLTHEQQESMGFTIPFSHNTGPGNSIQDASNTADEHSRIHDIEYAAGGNVGDADTNFVKHQFDHAIDDPIGSVSQVTGLIGGIGIKAKQIIESKLGQIYPSGQHGK